MLRATRTQKIFVDAELVSGGHSVEVAEASRVTEVLSVADFSGVNEAGVGCCRASIFRRPPPKLDESTPPTTTAVNSRSHPLTQHNQLPICNKTTQLSLQPKA